MKTKDFIDKVSEKAVQKAVGVGPKAVQSAKYADKFSASWYFALRKLAYEEDVDLDIRLFKWKSGE